MHDAEGSRKHDKDSNSARDIDPTRIDLRKIVLDELHQVPYLAHLGYQKVVIATLKL